MMEADRADYSRAKLSHDLIVSITISGPVVFWIIGSVPSVARRQVRYLLMIAVSAFPRDTVPVLNGGLEEPISNWAKQAH